jgi:flagellin-like hook-associated protein FlgL
MSSTISTNMASLYAQRSLATAQADLASSVEKLSSGKRINRAQDDAAGLGISEGIAGIRNISNQSIRNLQNASSLVQTADGALDVVGKLLQRALSLSAQKNDAVLSASQITSIDTEINSLTDEIGRIKSRTKFNGSASIFGQTYSFGAGPGVTTTFAIPDLTAASLQLDTQTRTIAVAGVTAGQQLTATLSPASANTTAYSAGKKAQPTFATASAIQSVSTAVAATEQPSDTFNIANTFTNGTELVYRQGTGNPIGGLTDNTSYFVTARNSSSFKLASSLSNATASTPIAIDLTSLGTATNAYFTNINNPTVFNINSVGTVNATTEVFVVSQSSNWGVGDKIFFHTGSASNIGGFTNDGVYTITSLSAGGGVTVNDLTGNPVLFDSNTNLNGATIEYAPDNKNISYNLVDTANDQFTSSNHGLLTGQEVFYTPQLSSGGTPLINISGLQANTAYFVISTGTNTFQLATTKARAQSGLEIDLTAVTGTGRAQFNYANQANNITSFTSNPVLQQNSVLLNNNSLSVGDSVTYRQGSGDLIGGLTNNASYFVVNNSNGSIKLSGTQGGTVISLTSAGSLTGSNFEKEARTVFNSTSSSVVNIASNTIGSVGAHGFANGNPIYYSTTGAAIGGLTSGTTYYAKSVTTNTFQLSTTSNGSAIALSGLSSGTQNFTNMASSTITANGHGFATNEAITYSTAGTPIGGLTSGNTYYAISPTTNTFQLSATSGGSAIPISTPGIGAQNFTPVSDTLTSASHGLLNGNAVVYTAGSTPISGLTNGNTYYVISSAADTFQLAATSGGTKINLTTIGDGSFTYMPASNAITANGHGFVANEAITYSTTGTPIGGLISGNTYYATSINANTFQLSGTSGGSPIPLTSPGSGVGTQSFTPVSDTLISSTNYNPTRGDLVTYSVAGGDTAIGGLTSGATYYAIPTAPNTFQLASSANNAANGIKINLTSAGTGAQNFASSGNSIDSTAHGLATGDQVIYNTNSGAAITGLTNGTTYYAIRMDANTFKLATSLQGSQSGTAINLSGSGNNAQTFTTPSRTISSALISNAIAINSTNRAELGSRLNALSYAIDSLETMSNNLSEAYSRIVDTDYAAETSNLTRNQILQEAAAAMLAQANQMPNVILSLLQ